MHEMQKTNVMLNILDKIKLKNADCKIKYLKNITRKSIPCREKKKEHKKTRSRFDIFMLFYTRQADCIFEKQKDNLVRLTLKNGYHYVCHDLLSIKKKDNLLRLTL